MKSLMLLWKQVAFELATWCCTSATRDFETVSARCQHEGLSFLTITLANFGHSFERSLELGQLDPDLFTSFKCREGLPLFLGGFLDLVFARDSGVLLDTPSIDAIQAVRQLTLMFSKVNVPCSKKRERAAIRRYVECEQELREDTLCESDISDFARVSSLLFRSAFTAIDHAIYSGDCVPRHGPGATADKLSGNGKYRQITWPSRLEDLFPFGENCLPNWSYYDQLESVQFLEPEQEYPVKVIPVPKTLKTPRIIAIEPTAMQYMQQAVLEVMLEKFKRDDILSSFLGFDDQEPNQLMARRGSLYGDLATLDLSEASDRVSNQHVKLLTGNHKWLSAALESTRSNKADVPNHGIISLVKFASMGSALCFPIEACVFLTLVMIGIERESNAPLTHGRIKSFREKVRIYGDDIIIPVDYVRSAIQTLNAFGHKVNGHKSFWNGKFRESCGKEYYEGHDVGIVKVRREFPASRRDVAGVISLVAMRNQFYERGYWQTAKYLDRKIGKLLKYFPVVLPTSPALGRHSFLGYQTERIGKVLHNPLVKGWETFAPLPSDNLEGSGALLKCFLKRGNLPFADSKHLERSGRPSAVGIKLRWLQPF